MTQFNIQNNNSIEDNYQQGFLPQRNKIHFWYNDSSSRSNLTKFELSSENRRIDPGLAAGSRRVAAPE